jgi:hypothetical protein
VAAHHIAHLGGEVEKKIVAWVNLWLPDMPQHKEARWPRKVKAKPLLWRTDTLAWRLRLTMAERTRLGITTIGALNMSTGRQAERRRRRRYAERERRARTGVSSTNVAARRAHERSLSH